ncbi:hypothetical protein SUDANB178_00847 [Streptomyces sp. enrichment culture]
MVRASDTAGSPRSITPFPPRVYVVPPDGKVSPGLPLIRPEAGATAVRAPGAPGLAGSHSAKTSAVPFLTYRRGSSGVRRPVSRTLPSYVAPEGYWAASLPWAMRTSRTSLYFGSLQPGWCRSRR